MGLIVLCCREACCRQYEMRSEVCQSVRLSIGFKHYSFNLSNSARIFSSHNTHLSVCVSVHLSVCVSVYLSVYMSVHLSVCVSVHLSVYLSITSLSL